MPCKSFLPMLTVWNGVFLALSCMPYLLLCRPSVRTTALQSCMLFQPLMHLLSRMTPCLIGGSAVACKPPRLIGRSAELASLLIGWWFADWEFWVALCSWWQRCTISTPIRTGRSSWACSASSSPFTYTGKQLSRALLSHFIAAFHNHMELPCLSVSIHLALPGIRLKGLNIADRVLLLLQVVPHSEDSLPASAGRHYR